LAIKEVCGEQFILSAVLHCDERNKALSDELGRDIFHYHPHVVYAPVVEKHEYFRRKKMSRRTRRAVQNAPISNSPTRKNDWVKCSSSATGRRWISTVAPCCKTVFRTHEGGGVRWF
jgi:hypothetical protein